MGKKRIKGEKSGRNRAGFKRKNGENPTGFIGEKWE